jgi:futalosine hydrolase
MLIIVVAVDAEAKAIGPIDGAQMVVSGVGRTNAACAATEAIINAWKRGGIDGVISAGVAGALPQEAGLQPMGIGDVLVASSCIYMEEGIVTARGFAGMESLGFGLGDFEGNAVPVDEQLLDRLGEQFRIGPIATVATCSGTDAAAREVVRRTGALAESMEGAAVVHAARRLKVPAIEVRAISNTCGDRASQIWDLQAGLAALGRAMGEATMLLRSG